MNELEDGEELLRAITGAAQDAILMMGSKGEILFWNPSAERMFGYTVEEALGRNLHELLAPARYLEAHRKAFSEFLRSGRGGSIGKTVELCALRKGGGEFTMSLSLTAVKLKDRWHAVGVIRDISESKEALDALRASETRYRRLFESTQDGILILEVETGRVIDANPFLLDLMGYSLDQVKTKRVWEIGSLKDIIAHKKKLVELQRHGYVRLENIPLKAKDGRQLHMEFISNVYPMGKQQVIQCNIRDITERRRNAAAVVASRQMESVLNTMLQHSLVTMPLGDKLGRHLSTMLAIPWLDVQPQGGVFLLGKGGRTLALAAQQGLSPKALRSCGEIPVGKCLCGRAAQSGKTVTSSGITRADELPCDELGPHAHYCAPINVGDKALGVLSLYLKPGATLDKQQERFIGAAVDILAENIVHSQLEAELAQAQKMESVGRLAGGVAHDFNNLLTVINGYAQFLLDALPPEDSKREDVREILSAGERAAGLTRQLLAFSRRQILNPQTMDINAAVDGTVKMLKRLIGEDIKLDTKFSTHACMVKIDAGQIAQVLLNLAVNARDAMPHGGTLTLETDIASADEGFSLAHPSLPRGPLVCLRVRDTGCGMTDEVKEHLFEPFYTTKEPGKGTGLGLATVFGIIKQSGGDILVESTPDHGTAFHIYFPRIDSVEKAKGQTKPKGNDAVLRGDETILLVEDEANIRRLGERALTANGYTVLTASDGQEALELLKRHGRPADLLITDVIMPGMNGRELARAIAQKNLAPRTLYFSGYGDDAIARHGVLEPGLAFLHKPFTPDALLRKLREVLDGPEDQSRA